MLFVKNMLVSALALAGVAAPAAAMAPLCEYIFFSLLPTHEKRVHKLI